MGHNRKDVIWQIPPEGDVYRDQAQLAVLMDLRNELKKLNTLLHCGNFTGIHHTLKGIRAKLPTRKRRKRKAT